MTDNSQEFNQRTIRAVVVCLLVVFVYTNFFLAPKKQRQAVAPQPQQTQQVTQPSSAGERAPASVTAQPSGPVQVVGVPQPAHPSAADVQAAGVTFVQSGLIRVGFSHLGGRVQSYSLNNYKAKQGDETALNIVGDLHDAALPLGIYRGSENDEMVRYTLSAVNGAAPASSPANLQIAPGGKVSLEFKGTLPSGAPITKTVTLSDNSYLFTVDVTLGSATSGQVVWLEWLHHYPAERSRSSGLPHVTYLDGANKIHHLSADQLKTQVRATTRWIALGDLYFMSSLIPALSDNNAAFARTGDLYIGRVAGSESGGSFTIFAGPKVYKMLEELGSYQLERSIDLGMFSFLALPLLWLLQYLYLIVHNYGLAIIALTLIIKTALLPLSQASFKSMKAMQEIQPEMKALRERVKDPTQLNQEIMALYKRRGVNPMGGCLPMFIQIPVFFGLYQALLNAIELRHASFALWITDLSSPEKLEVFGWGIPVMVLLMAASMVLQQWTTPNPSADPTQQKVMMLMPIVMAVMFIVFPMPAGLVLYWLVNNIISITQQMYLRKTNQSGVYWGTFVASVAIFGFGYILTLI